MSDELVERYELPSGWVRYGNVVCQAEPFSSYTWQQANALQETVSIKIIYKSGRVETRQYIATTMSKAVLDQLTKEQRATGSWYWTATDHDDKHWCVLNNGTLFVGNNDVCSGSARLGFVIKEE